MFLRRKRKSERNQSRQTAGPALRERGGNALSNRFDDTLEPEAVDLDGPVEPRSTNGAERRLPENAPAERVRGGAGNVTGWLAVTGGPGIGAIRSLSYGVNRIGRHAGERVPLDFGDDGITRHAHALIVYDENSRAFRLQHGGGANPTLLNGKPVQTPELLARGDQIQLGGTRLRFVPLCSESFDWTETLG